jgi:hypothetical protein
MGIGWRNKSRANGTGRPAAGVAVAPRLDGMVTWGQGETDGERRGWVAFTVIAENEMGEGT